jgi:hypothetical protein
MASGTAIRGLYGPLIVEQWSNTHLSSPAHALHGYGDTKSARLKLYRLSP